MCGAWEEALGARLLCRLPSKDPSYSLTSPASLGGGGHFPAQCNGDSGHAVPAVRAEVKSAKRGPHMLGPIRGSPFPVSSHLTLPFSLCLMIFISIFS